MPEDTKVYCVGCGVEVISESRKRYVMRNGQLKQVCYACYGAPRRLDNPFRELGYPDVQGGKQAPGVFQWRSKHGPGS